MSKTKDKVIGKVVKSAELNAAGPPKISKEVQSFFNLVNNTNAPKAEISLADLPKPLLSIVVMYDEPNEKKWLKHFLMNLPKLKDEDKGLIEVVLCKNIPDSESDSPKIGIETVKECEGLVLKFCKNFHHEFRFDVARNAAKLMASGDWILSLDTDEFIEQRYWNQIFHTINHAPKSLGGVYCTILSHARMLGSIKRECNSVIRMFRNDPEIKWQSQIHEIVAHSIVNDCRYSTVDTTITVTHLGYEMSDSETMKDVSAQELIDKYERNLEGLAREYSNPCSPLTKQHAKNYITSTSISLRELQAQLRN